MARDLRSLVDPGRTAVVTQECQKGVLGERAVFPELARVARASMLPMAARLVATARAARVPVVHCVAARRRDGLGSSTNARLFAAAARSGVSLEPGSEGTEIVEEIGLDDADLVSTRLHGVGPMWGTDLDSILRNLGVRTVVAIGVSVNVGVLSLVLDAVNAGYDVVLPRDAVCGIPPYYAEDVVRHTLSLVATVTTTDELVGCWR